MRVLFLLMLMSCTRDTKSPLVEPPVYDATRDLEVFDDVDAGVRCYSRGNCYSMRYPCALSCVKVR